MSFKVNTPALRSTGLDFGAMAAAYPAARGYLSHIAVTGSGDLLATLKPPVDQARSDLFAAYSPYGPFPGWLGGASLALASVADDYDGVDVAVAERLDSAMPTPANNRTKYGMSPDGEKPGVSTADVTGELQEPGTGFEDYDNWRRVVETVSMIASLAWLVEGVQKLISELGGPGRAMPNVVDNLRDLANVDWESVGRVASAVQCLSSFSDRVQDETAATTLELAKFWEGNAATAAYVNFGQFDDALGAHELDLQKMYGDLNNFAYGMRYLSDFVLDLLDALALAWPSLIEEGFEALAKGAAKALLSKLLFWVEVVLLAVSALFAFVGLFAITFGRIGEYDVSVPKVTSYVPPDVDGPR